MPVREFLRGGYRTIKEPTVISNHGHPIFTVMPGVAMRNTARAMTKKEGLPDDDHR